MSVLDRVADAAEARLGQNGPKNTCMSNGLTRWCTDAGVPDLDTDSVTEGIARAKNGYNGWAYHDGTDGLARGHFGVWAHVALGSVNLEHVTCVTQVNGSVWHGIGSGTPSGRVAMQPASGGYNPRSVLRGYLIPPAHAPVKPVKPATVKPKPVAQAGVYTVRAGDTLARIAAANGTTWQALMLTNPPAGGKSSDFHILRPNLILVGQKIRIP